jgi:hypothetical protein
MANLKRYVVGYIPSSPGIEPVIVIQRDADGFFWDDGVGFIANGGVPVENVMTEHFTDFWEYETSFEAWNSGTYNILITAPGDTYLQGYSETISSDTQIGFIQASSITSRNTLSSITKSLEPIMTAIKAQAVTIGVLSDRIDSLNAVLSRRDYRQ